MRAGLGRGAMLALLFGAFVVALAYGVALPILPFLLERRLRPGLDVGWHTGLLTAIYTFALFLFAPLWGQFYLPYFVHGEWLTVRLLESAIVYGGVELFDFIWGRDLTYAAYLALVIFPPLLSSRDEVRVFGILIALAFAITYAFFRFADISVFCFLGAIMSFYLLFMIHRVRAARQPAVA